MNEPKLFQIFKNSYVHIICKNLKSTQNKLSGHVVSEGFLTAYCNDYYYLAQEPLGDVVEAIRADDIVKVYLPIQELTEILAGQMGNEGMN
jgi:hypothetical protein